MDMKKRTMIILLGLGVVVFGLLYFWGYIPVSSLRSITMPELEGQMREICGEPQLYPPTVENWRNWSLPFFSPDGQYYMNIKEVRFRQAEVLKLFRADTNQLLGTHSYSNIRIYCWAPDSSGIYVADYIPGESSIFILFSSPGRTGPVKKLLVP